MPLFLFLVEVPGGLGDSESSFSENKGARPWVVTSMASLQLLSWFMIYKCFFCFSFAGGCGLLWISSHRSWTCFSGAPLKSRTSKSGETGSRPWVEIFEVFVISQNLEMLFLFCCVGGVSETPPPFVGPALQLSPMELHRSRHSHDILRAGDFRVVLAHMKFDTYMWIGRAYVKNVYFVYFGNKIGLWSALSFARPSAMCISVVFYCAGRLNWFYYQATVALFEY